MTGDMVERTANTKLFLNVITPINTITRAHCTRQYMHESDEEDSDEEDEK